MDLPNAHPSCCCDDVDDRRLACVIRDVGDTSEGALTSVCPAHVSGTSFVTCFRPGFKLLLDVDSSHILVT